MEFYEEIVNFIRANTLYQGHTLIKNTRKPNYSDDLYEYLISGEVKTDKEAAQLFFGVWDHKYRELKQRFISSITTSVLMIDWSGNRSMDKYQKAYYTLVREIAVAKILRGKTLFQSSVYYARRCYKKSKELACYDIMEDAVNILIRHYGARLKRQKEFEFYLSELHEAIENRRIERLADEYYSRMYIHLNKNRYNPRESISLYQSYYDQLSPYLASCNSFRYQLITRLIQVNIYNIMHAYEAMYLYSCKAVDYYLDRKLLHRTSLYIFLDQKTSACIKLGYYKEGLQTIDQSLKLLDDSNSNWYPIKQNEFFIYMQSGDYMEAYEVYKQVFGKKRYKNIPGYMKESWAVAEAYLHYVIESGSLNIERPAKYRVGRFLNTVPEFSKDKRSKNIPILIIQILFMLIRRRTDKAIDRIEAIEKYCSRYLRYNGAVRSNAFIKMLLEIPKNSFRKAAVLRKVDRYEKKLAEVPIHQSGKDFDLELIPYERLWKYAVSSLK